MCWAAELLHNWGVGLHSLGTHHPQPPAAAAALAEAAERLRASIQFNRADTAPLSALGDVLVAQAEHLLAQGSGDAPAAAAAALNAALTEAYGGALLIRATDPDALVRCWGLKPLLASFRTDVEPIWRLFWVCDLKLHVLSGSR